MVKKNFSRLLIIGVAIVFIGCDSSGEKPKLRYTMTPVCDSWFFTGEPNTVFFSFYLYLPDGYDGTDAAYPLVVYLQGGPINGPHPTPALLGAGPLSPLYVSDTALDPAGRARMNANVRKSIVVYPLMPYYDSTYRDPVGYYNPESIDKIVEYLKTNYRVDKSRMYLTGSSEGGGGAWGYVWAYAEKVAAVIPVSCRLSWPANNGLKSTPTWIFHSFDDYFVAHSDLDFDALTGANVMSSYPHLGGNVASSAAGDCSISYAPATGLGEWKSGTVYPTGLINYTLYSSGGHDAWTRTFSNDLVWDWLYAQAK